MTDKKTKTALMLGRAEQSVKDFIASGDDAGLHGQAEDLQAILEETSKLFTGGQTSPAAQTFVQRTGQEKIWYDEWSPRLGVDLSVLRFRLQDLDGKLNNEDLACWGWPDTRYI